jgi:DNA-binding response OmpR family regulator
MYHIHLVEDDADIRKGLLLGFEQEGYSVSWSDDGAKVYNDIKDSSPHIMILDIRLPGMDGLSVCRQLRNHGCLFPIIMLTARDEEIDRINGLETGADDYLVKPFQFRELVSRVRALLRRAYGEYSSQSTGSAPGVDIQKDGDFPLRIIEFDQYQFDLGSLRLWRVTDQSHVKYNKSVMEPQQPGHKSEKQEIFLTALESRLLIYFLTNKGLSLTRQQIIEGVWGPQIFLEDDRTVDVHIRHLREKIEPDPSKPKLILTVRGHGYRMVSDET